MIPTSTNPDETGPDKTSPDQTDPDETDPDEVNPDEINPDETNPDQTHPESAERDCLGAPGMMPSGASPESTNPDGEDDTTRLADELLRFARLGSRAKGILHKGEFGAEFSALMLLFPMRFLGPMRVTDLAEVKQADPSTISRQVAQLVKAGLARREADQVDGRASRLAITDAGMQACQRLHEARYTLLSEALGDWPAERIATFADLFREFNSSVEALMRKETAATSRENT
jgi:DNA-binding MarR family transcriptional regulator